MTMIDAHEHQRLGGPAEADAARRLESLGEQARYQGTVVTDRRRLQRIMTKNDPAVYPGKYVTCVHNHAKALCERVQRGHREGLPDHGKCRPFECRNVALTVDNAAAVREEICGIDDQLAAHRELPPLLAARLRQRRDTISTFLQRYDPTTVIP